MNAFIEGAPFLIRVAAGMGYLFTGKEALPVELGLLGALEELPPSGLLVVDASGMRVSSEAARQLLRRALRRVITGEAEDRFVVLKGLDESRYNVEVMLESEGLTAVERRDQSPILHGQVDPAVRETYEFVRQAEEVTARMVQYAFGLNNISTATNRLTGLSKLALARRTEQRAVPGGGREFVYAAVQ